MNNYNKALLSLVLAMAISGTVKSEIILTVGLESTAGGRFFDVSNEDGVDVVNFDNPQISETYGDQALGSAGTFDSISDLDGDEILFKNGNASYGEQASSSSRTVVNIDVTNNSLEAILPSFESQILPAGMGLYVSDCTAEDLRLCVSADGSFENITPFSGGIDTTIMSTEFIFTVLLEGFGGPLELYSLTGSLALESLADGSVRLVRELNDAQNRLEGFTDTSPEGSQSQLTYDWDATNFDVNFPEELAPGASARLKYIIEVNTTSDSSCIGNGDFGCPIAYGAFGDPIGRGGTARRQPDSTLGEPATALARSAAPAASFAMASNDTPINGYEPGLYRMALPTFEDGVISFMANSGPGINTTSVPAPASIVMLVLGLGYLGFSRKRY